MARIPNPKFLEPKRPDEFLSKVVGAEAMPRTEVVKRVWAYIKLHGLQNKTIIKADETLKPVFDGRDQVTMFEMTKMVFARLS